MKPSYCFTDDGDVDQFFPDRLRRKVPAAIEALARPTAGGEEERVSGAFPGRGVVKATLRREVRRKRLNCGGPPGLDHQSPVASSRSGLCRPPISAQNSAIISFSSSLNFSDFGLPRRVEVVGTAADRYKGSLQPLQGLLKSFFPALKSSIFFSFGSDAVWPLTWDPAQCRFVHAPWPRCLLNIRMCRPVAHPLICMNDLSQSYAFSCGQQDQYFAVSWKTGGFV